MPGNIQSIERAATILRLLSGRNRRLGVVDIAGEMGLPKGTVHGLLRTLQSVGFVEQDEDSGKYKLGAALLHMGSSYLDGNELRTRALNWSDALATRTREAVRIGTLHEEQVLVVHHVVPARRHLADARRGHRCCRHTRRRWARCCSRITPYVASALGASRTRGVHGRDDHRSAAARARAGSGPGPGLGGGHRGAGSRSGLVRRADRRSPWHDRRRNGHLRSARAAAGGPAAAARSAGIRSRGRARRLPRARRDPVVVTAVSHALTMSRTGTKETKEGADVRRSSRPHGGSRAAAPRRRASRRARRIRRRSRKTSASDGSARVRRTSAPKIPRSTTRAGSAKVRRISARRIPRSTSRAGSTRARKANKTPVSPVTSVPEAAHARFRRRARTRRAE